MSTPKDEKEVPTEQLRALEAAAAEQNMTSKDYVAGIVREALNGDLISKAAFDGGSFFAAVSSWDEATGGDAPMSLRETCAKEEWDELWEAIEEGHPPKIAKEAADVVWTVMALAKGYGVPFDDVWGEVAKSNFAKLGPSGELVRRESDGKIIKPPGWTPPELPYLDVCPNCNRDNDLHQIWSGRCVWCGFQATVPYDQWPPTPKHQSAEVPR